MHFDLICLKYLGLGMNFNLVGSRYISVPGAYIFTWFFFQIWVCVDMKYGSVALLWHNEKVLALLESAKKQVWLKMLKIA